MRLLAKLCNDLFFETLNNEFFILFNFFAKTLLKLSHILKIIYNFASLKQK